MGPAAGAASDVPLSAWFVVLSCSELFFMCAPTRIHHVFLPFDSLGARTHPCMHACMHALKVQFLAIYLPDVPPTPEPPTPLPCSH